MKNYQECFETEERGFFQGSLKVVVILAGLFAVGYLLSWLIG